MIAYILGLWAVLATAAYLIERQFHAKTLRLVKASYAREDELHAMVTRLTVSRAEYAHASLPAALNLKSNLDGPWLDPWPEDEVKAREAAKRPILKLTLIFAVLLWSASASAQSLHAPLGAIVAGNGLDLISTEIALQRASLREANPLLGASSAQRIAVKSASTLGQLWIVSTLGQRHPKLATVVGYAFGAAPALVAVHNMRVR